MSGPRFQPTVRQEELTAYRVIFFGENPAWMDDDARSTRESNAYDNEQQQPFSMSMTKRSATNLRLGTAAILTVILAVSLHLGCPASAAPSPMGRVVSWGTAARHPNVRPGTVFTDIVSAFYGTAGITPQGTLVHWGSGSSLPTSPDLSNVVAAGFCVLEHLFAL